MKEDDEEGACWGGAALVSVRCQATRVQAHESMEGETEPV